MRLWKSYCHVPRWGRHFTGSHHVCPPCCPLHTGLVPMLASFVLVPQATCPVPGGKGEGAGAFPFHKGRDTEILLLFHCSILHLFPRAVTTKYSIPQSEQLNTTEIYSITVLAESLKSRSQQGHPPSGGSRGGCFLVSFSFWCCWKSLPSLPCRCVTPASVSVFT